MTPQEIKDKLLFPTCSSHDLHRAVRELCDFLEPQADQPEVKERCENCRFWGEGSPWGYCQRRAPCRDDLGRSHFPMVNQYQWCGEWEQSR